MQHSYEGRYSLQWKLANQLHVLSFCEVCTQTSWLKEKSKANNCISFDNAINLPFSGVWKATVAQLFISSSISHTSIVYTILILYPSYIRTWYLHTQGVVGRLPNRPYAPEFSRLAACLQVGVDQMSKNHRRRSNLLTDLHVSDAVLNSSHSFSSNLFHELHSSVTCFIYSLLFYRPRNKEVKYRPKGHMDAVGLTW